MMFGLSWLKLGVVAGLLVAAIGGVLYYGGTRYDAGAASVQAKWDKAKLAQADVVVRQQARNLLQAENWADQFGAIGKRYEDQTHVQAPFLADAVAADVRSGAVRLRDVAPAATCTRGLSEAAARSRAADAAATAALAQRVQDSIAAVRAGDEADARERQLDEQVKGLQDIIKAERH